MRYDRKKGGVITDLAPSESKVQEEAFEYDEPTSEASIVSIGALANALREIVLPVGSVVDSMLDEATFQAQNTVTTRWVLADGRDVTGSKYQSLTGNTHIPDLRGIFRRGRNNGRSGSTGNPAGEVAVGTYEADQNLSHDHGFSDPTHTHTLTPNAVVPRINNYSDGSDLSAYDETGGSPAQSAAASSTGITFAANGGAESRPRNATLNVFIRIN